MLLQLVPMHLVLNLNHEIHCKIWPQFHTFLIHERIKQTVLWG